MDSEFDSFYYVDRNKNLVKILKKKKKQLHVKSKNKRKCRWHYGMKILWKWFESAWRHFIQKVMAKRTVIVRIRKCVSNRNDSGFDVYHDQGTSTNCDVLSELLVAWLPFVQVNIVIFCRSPVHKSWKCAKCGCASKPRSFYRNLPHRKASDR